VQVSPSGLNPTSDRLEALADLDFPCRVQLVHVDILELQHEAQPVVRVPAERESSDLLLAAIDPAGDAFRHPGNHVAVEADSAVACREFPRPDAAVLEAEQMIDLGPAPGNLLGIVGMESPVNTQLRST
jgi:hypothetical protein